MGFGVGSTNARLNAQNVRRLCVQEGAQVRCVLRPSIPDGLRDRLRHQVHRALQQTGKNAQSSVNYIRDGTPVP